MSTEEVLTRDAFVGVILLLVSTVLLHSVLRDGLHLDPRGVGQHAQRDHNYPNIKVKSLFTYRFEYGFIRLIINPIPQRVACAREVLSVLVEGHRHDTVCGVESLLHTVSMMDVNVDVQNSLVNCQNNVVDVAKPGGLRLLGVMQASSPVDGDVRLLFVQLHRTSWRTEK
ncbi:hypothetical protein F7725_007823, partial [Dissostichus mawsoni]